MRIALATIVFATLMVNGSKTETQTKPDAGNSNQSQRQTVTVVNQQAPEGQQGDHTQKSPSYLSRLFSPENLPNVTLVIVAAITALFILGQAKEMRAATDVMRGQLTAMQGQIGQMESSGVQTTALIAAAQKSADAAKISADIVARVSIPTLVVEKFEVGETGAANLEAFLQYPQISITLKNCGQTPAFLRSWTIIFTCEDLPDIPVYGGREGCGVPLDKVIVESGGSYTLPTLYFPRRQQLDLAHVKAVIAQQKLLNVYGFICYGDLFGNPLRRLKFCETALNLIDGQKPIIQWVDFGEPAYTGTDQFPFKKSTSGQGIEGQPSRADAKTEDRSEKAN